MIFYDSISILPEIQRTPADKEKMQKLCDEFAKRFAGLETFLHESPANRYYPEPARDEFALRSSKRRLFFKRVNGKIPMDIDLKNYCREILL
jgi:hypothetical protein